MMSKDEVKAAVAEIEEASLKRLLEITARYRVLMKKALKDENFHLTNLESDVMEGATAEATLLGMAEHKLYMLHDEES